MLDLLGHSLLDYQNGDRSSDVYVQTNISHREYLSRAHFFRSFSQMIPIEQQALTLSQGRTLDVGAGTGSHVLYLQEKGIEAIALDISPSAIEICKQRGVRVAICCDILQYEGQADTILMLMNGIGLCQKLSLLDTYLQKLKTLLTPHGQILLTSTDIIYMFDENPDGSYDVPLYFDYYGEVDYVVKYKGQKEKPFPWMYVDYNTLQNVAISVGLECELIAEGEHFDYLAKLSN